MLTKTVNETDVTVAQVLYREAPQSELLRYAAQYIGVLEAFMLNEKTHVEKERNPMSSRMQEVIEMESEHQRLAHELRVACDRLNEAIAQCTRRGVSVEVETVQAADPTDRIVREIVRVRPFVMVRY